MNITPIKTVTVVIPVYNELKTIEKILSLVEAQPMVSEIILVDDASTDGTVNILKRYENTPKYKIFYHERNKGKGAALRTGFEKASGEIVIVQDADLEYDPGDYAVLLDPIFSGRADVVFGSRFLGGQHRVLYFWNYAANRFLTFFSNMINNLNLSDMEVCYKVFKSEILRKIELTSNRFGFEPEITAKVAKLNAVIYEVPIRYYGRTFQEGKKIGWKDGVAAIWWIIKYGVFK